MFILCLDFMVTYDQTDCFKHSSSTMNEWKVSFWCIPRRDFSACSNWKGAGGSKAEEPKLYNVTQKPAKKQTHKQTSQHNTMWIIVNLSLHPTKPVKTKQKACRSFFPPSFSKPNIVKHCLAILLHYSCFEGCLALQTAFVLVKQFVCIVIQSIKYLNSSIKIEKKAVWFVQAFFSFFHLFWRTN